MYTKAYMHQKVVFLLVVFAMLSLRARSIEDASASLRRPNSLWSLGDFLVLVGRISVDTESVIE